jgi:hypothetical protein
MSVPVVLQRGEAGSGLEFLIMNRAMIEVMRTRFGDLPIEEVQC